MARRYERSSKVPAEAEPYVFEAIKENNAYWEKRYEEYARSFAKAELEKLLSKSHTLMDDYEEDFTCVLELDIKKALAALSDGQEGAE